ncbi:hypothetical protein E2562_008585 [Oryza meyeriana var. granulata]|uniref:Uncharacterized protein n=1 Tax=Oryza meyeriana var. granulata TaxID=110450 RepID=A0A6G1C636_9ORYZ|nr:hypothetical protein E2562_008585 [Oryza meyeriana var. granulata]
MPAHLPSSLPWPAILACGPVAEPAHHVRPSHPGESDGLRWPNARVLPEPSLRTPIAIPMAGSTDDDAARQRAVAEAEHLCREEEERLRHKEAKRLRRAHEEEDHA